MTTTSSEGEQERVSRPVGVPIRACLDVPETAIFDFVRQTVALIDSVHGDGELQRIPVRRATDPRIGYYQPKRTDEERHFAVSRLGHHPHLTMAHEIGHMLDDLALGSAGTYASETRGVRELMRTIDASIAIRQLVKITDRKQTIVTPIRGPKRVHIINNRYVRYLLLPREKFARAYAQYIAHASRHPILIGELDRIRAETLTQQVYYEQWSDEDFAAISLAFNRLMHRKKWIQ